MLPELIPCGSIVIAACEDVVTSPVISPVKVPAIAPVPVIVGEVNVLLVNVCVADN